MAYDLLQVCREYFEKTYLQSLDIGLTGSVADIATSRNPVWITVSAENLTEQTQSTTSGSAGLLLDPEIGLLCYVLPFDEKSNSRKQVTRALAVRSQLATERHYTSQRSDEADSRGAWRVAMHWLVQPGAKAEWLRQMANLRRETAFSEEVSMDALFLQSGELLPQLARYAFPRLLMTTRTVFRKKQFEDVVIWQSADELVKQELAKLPFAFQTEDQQKLAKSVVDAMADYNPSQSTQRSASAPDSPVITHEIRACNFRNLNDCTLSFGNDLVASRVVHGPNGTGKSSLCEAVSIALFQSSFRYKAFADKASEPDAPAGDRAREYIRNYLTPIDKPDAQPQLAVDGEKLSVVGLQPPEATLEIDLAMCGTILTQDTSLGFARMTADELGSRLLRGYSQLAEHVEEFADRHVNQANNERTEFLRRLGLPASIAKIATAFERIARQEIDRLLPPLPSSFVEWLLRIPSDAGSSERELALRWNSIASDSARVALATELSKMSGQSDSITRRAREWLNAFNELVARSSELLRHTEERSAKLRSGLADIKSKIAIWGGWLEKNVLPTAELSSAQVESQKKKVEELRKRLADITTLGQAAKEHLDHLVQAETFIRGAWSKLHVNTCPTCGVDHSSNGGILKVVEAIRSGESSLRERLREQYSTGQAELESAQRAMAELGQSQCPLSTEEQALVVESVQWLLPANQQLSSWIAESDQRSRLLENVEHAARIPSIPAEVDVEGESARFALAVLQKFSEATATFESPTNWKPVKESITKMLANVVATHLPQTLEKLWCELTLNLTSAPWLLPATPCFNVAVRRGEKKSTLRVKDRLARYVLNQSEIHVLGLAWFFTKYLTHGRFFNACLVMDDPAQEMDQTSFRDLCRLLETLVRLHRVYQRPLALVLMFNQESRAIDAARSTDGILTVLNWSREQEQGVRSIRIVGEGFYPRQPTTLFQRAAN